MHSHQWLLLDRVCPCLPVRSILRYCHLHHSSLIAPLMPNGLPANRATLQSQREITIANDLIGCIIGRGGQKISEIR